GRSSAMTFCIRAHCSVEAPAGRSQMIDQAPWLERTVPGCCWDAVGARSCEGASVGTCGAGSTGCWARAGSDEPATAAARQAAMIEERPMETSGWRIGVAILGNDGAK